MISAAEHNPRKSIVFGGVGTAFFIAAAILFCVILFNDNGQRITKSQHPTLSALFSDSLVASQPQPNFVFVLIDDLGSNNIGYDQRSTLSDITPNMNELARNGVIMDNYYTQELCTPARAALMTGRYPTTLGMQFGEIQFTAHWGVNLEETFLPEVLKANGYKTYGLGKWNLGSYTAEYLPTARGFDNYLGFMSSHASYWSHEIKNQYDFMTLNTECYSKYDAYGEYSTTVFEDLAITAINNHDFSANPMFLYIASQATHDPFGDSAIAEYSTGVPTSYVDDDIYSKITTTVSGDKQQQLLLSLNLLDKSVGSIYEALKARDQAENTYFIVTSDNGGCPQGGSRNGKLRGCKGTLYEGGTKVDAFIYSDLLPTSSKSTTYSGLTHVTDWFPTILELAGITYSSASGYALDGVSQVSAMLSNTDSISSSSQTTSPREYMLYNAYVNVEGYSFSLDSYTNAAVRDYRYKLLYAHVGSAASQWYDASTVFQDDDQLTLEYSDCAQEFALEGTFTYMLFDLESDPYETTNLYNNASYANVQNRLTEQLENYVARAAYESSFVSSDADAARAYWAENGDYVQPWVNAPSLSATYKSSEYHNSNEKSNSRQTMYPLEPIAVDQSKRAGSVATLYPVSCAVNDGVFPYKTETVKAAGEDHTAHQSLRLNQYNQQQKLLYPKNLKSATKRVYKV